MNEAYFKNQIDEYLEMARHIKAQRDNAESEERRSLTNELERIFNEINVIKDHFGW